MNDEQLNTNAVAKLRLVLEEIGWEPRPIEPNAFHIDFGPPYLPISTGFAGIVAETSQFILYLNFGLKVPPERRDKVMSFITRANWGLIIGNFEFDLDDGHIRFKTSLDFGGAEPSSILISNAILGAMNAVDSYSRSLMDIAVLGLIRSPQSASD